VPGEGYFPFGPSNEKERRCPTNGCEVMADGPPFYRPSRRAEPKRGVVWALRFYAAGERRYETLGSDADGWNRRRAEDELAAVMAAVRAGTWAPRAVEQALPADRAVTFHEFASDWLANREHELRPTTVADYRWVLSYHLLPFFAEMRVGEISVADVDRYKAAKLAEGGSHRRRSTAPYAYSR
jgi:Phage integrase, N-terminal SAM-like domain